MEAGARWVEGLIGAGACGAGLGVDGRAAAAVVVLRGATGVSGGVGMRSGGTAAGKTMVTCRVGVAGLGAGGVVAVPVACINKAAACGRADAAMAATKAGERQGVGWPAAAASLMDWPLAVSGKT